MAAEVAWLAKSLGDAETDEEILDVTLRAIRAVVEKELMQIGDVTDGGFFEWELTPEESLVRVQREWSALGRSPGLGEVCWLANTGAGDIRAKTILRSRR